jgi:hypothetical protein
VCWAAAALGMLRGRRHAARQGPNRWHHAVDTLRGWSAGDDLPVAATWCRPLSQRVALTVTDQPPLLPVQRIASPHDSRCAVSVTVPDALTR